VLAFSYLGRVPTSNSKRQDGNSNSFNRYASCDSQRRLAEKIFWIQRVIWKEQESSYSRHRFGITCSCHQRRARLCKPRLLNAVNAAAVLGDCNACIGDLPRARLSRSAKRVRKSGLTRRAIGCPSTQGARWIDWMRRRSGLPARGDRPPSPKDRSPNFLSDDFTHAVALHFGDYTSSGRPGIS